MLLECPALSAHQPISRNQADTSTPTDSLLDYLVKCRVKVHQRMLPRVISGSMSPSGGGLPQRPPRQSRRRGCQPSSTQQQSADEAELLQPECPDEPMPLCKPGTNSGDSGGSQPVNTCDDAGSASKDSMSTEPAYCSDRHTDGALRSARVGEYKFECAPHAESYKRPPTVLRGLQH